MEKQLLTAFVRSSIATTCKVDESTLHESCRLADIGLDSLALTTIVSEIETAYGRAFTVSETLDFLNTDTVGDLVTRLSSTDATR